MTIDLATLCRETWCRLEPIARVEAAFDSMAAAITGDLDPALRIAFRSALDARERVTTTALGGGIAIPHARMPGLAACRLGLGSFPAGLDMPSRDGARVDLLAVLLTREEDHSEHLRLLAAVASRFADRHRRERLRRAAGPAELRATFIDG